MTADLRKLSAGRADYYVREVARAHADQPRTRPSQADQPRSARADKRQRGGREREAG